MNPNHSRSRRKEAGNCLDRCRSRREAGNFRSVPEGSFVLAFALLFCSISSHAQRTFSVSLGRTNGTNVVISWKAQSATPVNDLLVVPQFRVQRSSDLVNWMPITAVLSPSLGQTVSIVDTNSTAAFYRVISIISKEYAQLNQKKLSNAGFMGADFFGASLFGSKCDNADFSGANLSGTDLRGADFT